MVGGGYPVALHPAITCLGGKGRLAVVVPEARQSAKVF